MLTPPTAAVEAPARVLALLVAANGRIDEREMAALDRLDAFVRLGVGRKRFLEMSRECIRDVGASLCERSWLRTTDLMYVNALLDAVPDESQRLLVCRFGAAAITADGRVTGDERLVYNHTLARWRIRQDQVSQAILHDAVH